MAGVVAADCSLIYQFWCLKTLDTFRDRFLPANKWHTGFIIHCPL